MKLNKNKKHEIPFFVNPTKTIRIKYLDFWPDFSPESFFITDILSKRYNLTIFNDSSSKLKPNYVIYSCFGNKHKNYKCTKIYYTYERTIPNFNDCNYAIGLRFLNHPDKRYFRNPIDLDYFLKLGNLYNISISKNFNTTKRKFCAWLVSNSGCYVRNKFYKMLSKYKKVDSGGGFINNIGFKIKNKTDFFKNYKFAIVFENSKYLGYCTEKITDAFSSGTIPIYWGDDSILNIFNNKSYIHIRNETEFEKKINYIIKIDQNDTLYNEVIHEKIILNENEANNMKQLENFLYDIFDRKQSLTLI